jgi:hypothetical protein
MRVLPVKPLLLIALLLPALPASWAAEPADQIERAKLLRELLEQRPAAVVPAEPARELPGAKLDVDAAAVAARERLQNQGFDDAQWRRLLGEQQTGKIREGMTGIPSGAPARAAGFERDQRARGLSQRIQQQNLQFRQSGP